MNKIGVKKDSQCHRYGMIIIVILVTLNYKIHSYIQKENKRTCIKAEICKVFCVRVSCEIDLLAVKSTPYTSSTRFVFVTIWNKKVHMLSTVEQNFVNDRAPEHSLCF